MPGGTWGTGRQQREGGRRAGQSEMSEKDGIGGQRSRLWWMSAWFPRYCGLQTHVEPWFRLLDCCQGLDPVQWHAVQQGKWPVPHLLLRAGGQPLLDALQVEGVCAGAPHDRAVVAGILAVWGAPVEWSPADTTPGEQEVGSEVRSRTIVSGRSPGHGLRWTHTSSPAFQVQAPTACQCFTRTEKAMRDFKLIERRRDLPTIGAL